MDDYKEWVESCLTPSEVQDVNLDTSVSEDYASSVSLGRGFTTDDMTRKRLPATETAPNMALQPVEPIARSTPPPRRRKEKASRKSSSHGSRMARDKAGGTRVREDIDSSTSESDSALDEWSGQSSSEVSDIRERDLQSSSESDSGLLESHKRRRREAKEARRAKKQKRDAQAKELPSRRSTRKMAATAPGSIGEVTGDGMDVDAMPESGSPLSPDDDQPREPRAQATAIPALPGASRVASVHVEPLAVASAKDVPPPVATFPTPDDNPEPPSAPVPAVAVAKDVPQPAPTFRTEEEVEEDHAPPSPAFPTADDDPEPPSTPIPAVAGAKDVSQPVPTAPTAEEVEKYPAPPDVPAAFVSNEDNAARDLITRFAPEALLGLEKGTIQVARGIGHLAGYLECGERGLDFLLLPLNEFFQADGGQQLRGVLERLIAVEICLAEGTVRKTGGRKKAVIPVSKRPKVLSAWISNGRCRLGKTGAPMPRIVIRPGDFEEFVRSWETWWSVLQPGWRVRLGDRWERKTYGEDWHGCIVPGQNGWLGVVATLSWWGSAMKARKKGEEEWLECVTDVEWMLTGLLAALRTGL